MDAAAAQGVEKFGEINVACCNAGVCRLAPFEEMDDKTRDFHIDVNIKVYGTPVRQLSHTC